MTSVISAVGEATGMKPDDKVIGLSLMAAAQANAKNYLAAVISSTSPDLRHVFMTHLQDEIAAHERATRLAVERGWLRPDLSARDWIKMAASDAETILK